MSASYCDYDSPGTIDLNDVLEQQFAEKQEEGCDNQANHIAGERITTASMKQVMVGEVMSLVASAYRIEAEPGEGMNGRIEFHNSKKKATGLHYRVQLKSGDSHLRTLKVGTDKFPMKSHYEGLWACRGAVPVLLIIRASDGRTHFVNATKAIRAAQKANLGKPVRQIVFEGEDFDKESILRLRDERLK